MVSHSISLYTHIHSLNTRAYCTSIKHANQSTESYHMFTWDIHKSLIFQVVYYALRHKEKLWIH